MKKSNTLMLSYMIFLGVAILAQIIFEWEGLNRIAIAATIAGCFFAFADLANWYVSYKTPLTDTLEKTFEVEEAHYFAIADTIQARRTEAENIIEILNEYQYRGENIVSMIEKSFELIDLLAQCKEELDDTRSENEDLLRRINKLKSNSAIVNKIEAFLMTAGFVLFFSLITFDWMLNVLSPHQEIGTVVAFIVIMLNYYLRDLLEDKTKNKVNELLSEIDSRRSDVENMRNSLAETPALDMVKDFVATLEHEDDE